jgi:hypothetical protein
MAVRKERFRGLDRNSSLEDRMPKVEYTAEILVPQARVFELTQDYQLRKVWDPFITDSKLLDGASQASVGVKNWVRA